MKKHTVSIIGLVATFFVLVNATFAEQKAASLDAHVHGLSQLTIAVEGETVELQFSSPAMNLVGFEHRATSKKDIAAVKQAESILRQPEMLFALSDAGCKPIHTHVDISGLIEQHDHHDGHKGHDEHKDHHDDHDDHDDHDEHNDHDDHKDHMDHHDHKAHDQHETHSEIMANYSFECKDSSTLSSVKVSLFESFAGIYKIQTMWVTSSNQGSAKLTADNPAVLLR
ncbi:MAG: ZrgA family zinc uptake protein [Porticoccaceae bacterium]